jgi:hypothetical protein
MPSFTISSEGRDGHKDWPRAAADKAPLDGRDREEDERCSPALEELMMLVRLHEEHDTGPQLDSLSVDDGFAAAARHNELVIPGVGVHRGVAALAYDELVHRGLASPVLMSDELSHPDIVAPFLQEADGTGPFRSRRVHRHVVNSRAD